MRVGESVDHRDLAVLGEVVDVLLGEGADHDAVDVAAHHVRGVLDGLADAQLDVVGAEEHGLGAELLDADLEAHAGARAGLHEDHGDGAAGEHGMRLAALLSRLELGSEVEQRDHFGRREVVDREEAAAGEVELGDARLELPCGHAALLWRDGRRYDPAPGRRAGEAAAGTGRSAFGPRRVSAARGD